MILAHLKSQNALKVMFLSPPARSQYSVLVMVMVRLEGGQEEVRGACAPPPQHPKLPHLDPPPPNSPHLDPPPSPTLPEPPLPRRPS